MLLEIKTKEICHKNKLMRNLLHKAQTKIDGATHFIICHIFPGDFRSISTLVLVLFLNLKKK